VVAISKQNGDSNVGTIITGNTTEYDGDDDTAGAITLDTIGLFARMNSTPSAFFHGRIAEVRVYTGTSVMAAVPAIVGFLRRKWRIAP
jgi:hypothetical protein